MCFQWIHLKKGFRCPFGSTTRVSLSFKISLKMVRFLLLSTLLLFHEVASMCPDLKKNYYKENYLNGSRFSNLIFYKYKPVDLQIQSPFFVDEGPNKIMLLQFLEITKQILSLCRHHIQNANSYSYEPIYYKKVTLNQTNESNILQVDYEQHTLASGSNYKMEKIYVIDYLSGPNKNNFISLYGCKMVEVDGKMTMFEGTIIISDFFSINKMSTNSNLFWTRPTAFYKTRQISQRKAWRLTQR